jgi:hypothetical protein
MAFKFEQAVDSALNLAHKQYEELEKEVGDKRIHRDPSRCKQRRARNFIEEKYNAFGARTFSNFPERLLVMCLNEISEVKNF